MPAQGWIHLTSFALQAAGCPHQQLPLGLQPIQHPLQGWARPISLQKQGQPEAPTLSALALRVS